MNTFKNALIAILTGLLALSLFTQPAQSATSTVTTAQFNALQDRVKVLESNAPDSVKTFHAVRLANYTACLYYRNPDGRMYQDDINGNRVKSYIGHLDYCASWKP